MDKRCRGMAGSAVGFVLIAACWNVPVVGRFPGILPVSSHAEQDQSGDARVLREAVSIPAPWIPGYANEISGETISYPSAYPGQLRTLLTRATDGKMRIEWEAQAPPPGPDDALVHYVWHAGLASGYGAHAFAFAINGTPCATFRSGRDAKDREWSVKGDCGATLAFKTTRVGTFNELFGLMVFSVPRRVVGPGRPRFSAVGEAAGSQDYYLVFGEPLSDWVRVMPEQAILTGGRRAVRVEISHVADAQPARVLSGATELWSGMASPGYTSILISAPADPHSAGRPRSAEDAKPTGSNTRTRPPAGSKSPKPGGTRRARVTEVQLPIVVELGGRQALAATVTLAPVRAWQIHLLPHSHVDIGYSDLQPEVERKQWKNLRDAVDLALKTAGYPREARFRWNVEGLWSVESYLRQASEDERRAFVEAVRQGSVGMQGNYTNILTGLASPEELTHWTDAARQLRSAYGFGPMRSAMHSDIPGISWPSVQALAEAGVRYFSSGPNYMPSLPDRGDRIGGTLSALGDRPFWWMSPSGNERVLFWMAGHGYSWFHGLNAGSLTTDRGPILDYLRDLEHQGYEWDLVQVRYTVGGDNGPVDPHLPDFVRAWNGAFDSPKLVINTAEAMFAEFERRYGARLPRRAGDMTPYWEDGAVSSAAEEAMVRASARRLVQAETLWSLRSPATFPHADAAEAWRAVILWHEHTWGAADSINQPDRADVVAQWMYKRQFAVEADRRSRALFEAVMTLDARSAGLKNHSPRHPNGAAALGTPPTRSKDLASIMEIANTASWPRGGVVVLPENLTAGLDRATDAAGRPVPTQRLKDGRLAALIQPVPAFGAYRLTLTAGRPASLATGVSVTGTTLDNGVLRVTIDPRTGDITSLRSLLPPRLEFASASHGLNGYLYVPGRDPSQAERTGIARVIVEEPGPMVATLRVESAAPGTRSLVRRVTLAAGRSVLELEDTLDKAPVRTKESAHMAFPFTVTDATVRVDEGGAVVVPERDQIPGSCRDFVGPHSAVDVSSRSGAGISLVTLDAPLIEIGAMTDERLGPKTGVRSWRTSTAPGSAVYAYLLNNYWHTNYKADQEGPLTFRFALRPHGEQDDSALRRFGADQEQPLVAYAVTADTPAMRAPFRIEATGIVVSSIRTVEGPRGLLVRLYNASSNSATARIAGRGGRIRVEATSGDRNGAMPNGTIRMKAFATVTVRVAAAR